MQPWLSVNKTLLTGIALAWLAFFAMLLFSYRQTQYANTTAGIMAHTQQELFAAEQVLTAITENESGSRGYLITGDDAFLEPLERSNKNIYAKIDTLQHLTADSKKNLLKIDSLRYYTSRRIAFSDSTVELRRHKGLENAAALVESGRGKIYGDNARRIIGNLQQEANNLMQKNKAENLRAIAWGKIILLLITLAILALMIIFFWKEKQRAEKKVPEKTQEQLTYLSRQINQSNDAIYTLNEDRRIQTWNKGAEVLYGFTEAEALGKDPIDFLQTDISSEEVTIAMVEIKERDYWAGDLRRTTRDGRSIYVNTSISTIRDQKSEITGFVAVSRDITEQKKLYQQVNHLANIVEQSSEAIFSRDQEHRFISWNKGAENLFGVSRKEAIGKTPAELGLLKLSPAEIAANEKQMQEKGSWKAELYFQHKDGSTFFGAITGNIIKNEKGKAAFYYFIVKDISVRKQMEDNLKAINEELELRVQERTEEIAKSEKRYKALVENNEDVISVLDKNLVATYRSASAARITGWTNDEFAGVDTTEYIHPDYLQYIQEQMKQSLQNPGSLVPVKLQVKHKKGHYIWMEGTIINMLHDSSVEGIITNIRDVTQRIQAEEKLAASEKRFRALLENNFDVISLMDTSFSIFYRSPSAARVTGWSDEDMLNADGTTHIHPDDKEYARRIVQELMEKPGKSINTLFRNLHKDGHYLWMEGTVVNMLHDENIKAIVFNYRDVTQRIDAEKKLVSNENRFRSLVENNKDVIMLLDETFKVTYRTPSATTVNGWTDEDVKTMSGIQNIHPDDRSYAEEMIAGMMANPGRAFPVTFRNRHKNGLYRWLEGTVTNFLEDPNVGAILFNFRDVTERIEAAEKLSASEIRFRSLIENISDGIILYDEAFNFLYQSPSVSNILGNSIKEKSALEVLDLIHPHDREYVVELYRSLKHNPGKPIAFKYRFMRTTGTYVWLEGYITNMLDEPSVKAYIGNYRDITERMEAEMKIKQLNIELEEKVFSRTEQLRKSNEELEAFSYSVSHDLRAPLRAIMGFSNILEEDYGSKLDDEAKRLTGVIKNNTQKMGILIDDLLAFSKMGKHQLYKTIIDTNTLVDDVKTNLYIPDEKANKITWIVHKLPAIKADIISMRQVWINLLSNAVKYSGKAALPCVETGSFEQDGQIVFYVKDNGVGFNEQYKTKLFKVFQRLHSTEEFEGTGIGLAIVDKIISKHGGKVWAEAEVDKGACFYFSLPAS